jgi:hypothetical protein
MVKPWRGLSIYDQASTNYTACRFVSKYPKHDWKVLAINGYFSIMSQWDAGVNRFPPAGALAIMARYSQ